jgi:hypothetical protein
MSTYVVSIRGPVPPDLAQRVAKAHAAAVKAMSRPSAPSKKGAATPRRGLKKAQEVAWK